MFDKHLNNYALIIGVQEYRAFDPGGGSDVAGALNDARAMVHECLAMGFSSERIRVLTSPVLSASDVAAVGAGAGIAFAEATRANIEEGLRWLYRSLSCEEPAAGLASFSGHGLMSPGLALAPADFDGSQESLVLVADVRRGFGDGKAARALTVLLDCCHAQGNAEGTKSIAARLAALAKGLPGGAIPERVLAACETGQVSVASRFGGQMQGAFTWAATSVLGQWKTKVEERVARVDVSYGELRERIGALLGALSFEQAPVLAGPVGVAKLPFLYPGRRGALGETTEDPNAERPDRQLEPSKVTISAVYTDGQENGSFGEIYATGSNQITLRGKAARTNTEYWYLQCEPLETNMPMPIPIESLSTSLTRVNKLKFTSVDLTSSGSYKPKFVAPLLCSQTSSWTKPSGLVRDGKKRLFFEGKDPNNDKNTIYLQFILDAYDIITKICWYQKGSGAISLTGEYTKLSGEPTIDDDWYVSNDPSLGYQFAAHSEQDSGYYLGLRDDPPVTGTRVVLKKDKKTSWLWQFIGDKRWYVRLEENPDLYLQGSKNEKTQLELSRWTGDGSIKWVREPAPSMYSPIYYDPTYNSSRQSDRMVIDNKGAEVKDGNPIQTYESTYHDNQMWVLSKI